VRLLGPLAAEVGGADLPLGGLKQRAVFALLAVHAGRVVPRDRIADQLWPDEPPSRATTALQSYVSRLRRLLAEAGADGADGADGPQIVTRPPGWVLTLDPGEVDASRFVSMVDQGRHLLLEGTREGAALAKSVLESALGLWVGDPLVDLDSIAFAHEEADHLGEVRLAAIELLLEARPAEGESDSVVDQARGFVTENPFRERGWAR
jgi:DNA-binding SARP family transcriptional activator